MDMEHIGTAKVVKALLEAADKLDEAKSGAQYANDEPLFGRIMKHQMALWDLASELVKTKKERPNG